LGLFGEGPRFYGLWACKLQHRGRCMRLARNRSTDMGFWAGERQNGACLLIDIRFIIETTVKIVLIISSIYFMSPNLYRLIFNFHEKGSHVCVSLY